MSISNYNFSKSKTVAIIFIYLMLFLIGNFFGSFITDLIYLFIKSRIQEIYIASRMSISLIITIFLFWNYTIKVLHLKMNDFRINLNIKKGGIVISILLPLFVLGVFMTIGEYKFNILSSKRMLYTTVYSLIIILNASIVEEILFRGFIMKLLEDCWNRRVAILVQSFIFSIAHIPSMQGFDIVSLILLIVSITLLGVVFSLITYKWNSISNSALLHTLWNFFIITDIAHITTAQNAYGNPLLSVTIPSNNILLTGGRFGVEASLIAIIGYVITCIFIIISEKKNI